MKILASILFFQKLSISLAGVSPWEERFQSLEKRLEKVEQGLKEEKQFISVCGFKSEIPSEFVDITYDNVFHSATNVAEGGLDTCSGRFTAGVSGSYSVSWSGYSDARGGGLSVGLMKNGRSVTGTESTWTMQGRSVTINLKKGDQIYLRHFGMYDYRKISFCVTLVQAYDVMANEEGKKSTLELIPSLDTSKAEIPTYSLYLNLSEQHKNTQYIQSITNVLNSNKSNTSTVCEDEFKRTCKEPCNSFGFNKCEAGCKFDMELLGECKESSFGYMNHPDIRTSINPCFFLRFKASSFLNLSSELSNTVQCKADILFKESKMYNFLSTVDKNSLNVNLQESFQFFIDNEEIFQELNSIDDEDLKRMFDIQLTVDGLKFMRYIKKYPQIEKLVAEYLPFNDTYTMNSAHDIGRAIEGVRLFNMIPDEKRDELVSEILNNRYEGSFYISSLIDYYQPFYENIVPMKKVIANAETEGDQDILNFIQEKLNESDRGQLYKYTFKRHFDYREPFKKFVRFKESFRKFSDVIEVLEEVKKEKANVPTKLFPADGTLPTKYLLLNGEEESPIVAIKVLFEDNTWITTGQEVLVACEVLYTGFDKHKMYFKLNLL